MVWTIKLERAQFLACQFEEKRWVKKTTTALEIVNKKESCYRIVLYDMNEHPVLKISTYSSKLFQ